MHIVNASVIMGAYIHFTPDIDPQLRKEGLSWSFIVEKFLPSPLDHQTFQVDFPKVKSTQYYI